MFVGYLKKELNSRAPVSSAIMYSFSSVIINRKTIRVLGLAEWPARIHNQCESASERNKKRTLLKVSSAQNGCIQSSSFYLRSLFERKSEIL